MAEEENGKGRGGARRGVEGKDFEGTAARVKARVSTRQARCGWGVGVVGARIEGGRMGDAATQLGGHGEGGEVVATSQFAMPEDESRAQGEGDQQNQGDRGQTMVGDGLALAGRWAARWAVAASVEEAMLEVPVLGKIHPAVVLVFPTGMAEATHDRSGKGHGHGGNPNPFLASRFRLLLLAAVMPLGQPLLSADDPQGLRMILPEGESRLFPEMLRVGLARLRLGEGLIGWARLK